MASKKRTQGRKKVTVESVKDTLLKSASRSDPESSHTRATKEGGKANTKTCDLITPETPKGSHSCVKSGDSHLSPYELERQARIESNKVSTIRLSNDFPRVAEAWLSTCRQKWPNWV